MLTHSGSDGGHGGCGLRGGCEVVVLTGDCGPQVLIVVVVVFKFLVASW